MCYRLDAHPLASHFRFRVLPQLDLNPKVEGQHVRLPNLQAGSTRLFPLDNFQVNKSRKPLENLVRS